MRWGRGPAVSWPTPPAGQLQYVFLLLAGVAAFAAVCAAILVRTGRAAQLVEAERAAALVEV